MHSSAAFSCCLSATTPLRIPPFPVPAPIEMLSIIVRRIDHFAFTFSFAFTYRVHLPLLIATRASSSYCCCCCCQETLQHTITIFHFPYSETTTTAAATINGAIFNYHFRISRSLLIVSVCFSVCLYVCACVCKQSYLSSIAWYRFAAFSIFIQLAFTRQTKTSNPRACAALS